MNDKELRAEVQLIRDELARYQRIINDALQNIDSDNFGKSLSLEYGKMRTKIDVTAKAIKTMVSDTDLAEELEKYSTITQTAEAIQTVVSKGANLDNAVPIASLADATDPTLIYVIQSFDVAGNVVGETYYYYNDILHQWDVLSGDSIYTVFNQTSSGFEMRGNVVIDGNAVVTRNLTLSGHVTWDMDNSPVQTRYSSDCVNWHSPMASTDAYMQMSFDGGASWSDPTKVVGSDGKNGQDGEDGSDANVTPETVFDALTDDGARQGIFAAFVNNNNQIYINAEYLATKIAEVAEKIYIGDYNTSSQQKSIYFNDQANISTFDSMYGHNGIVINSNGLKIASNPDKIQMNIPESTDWISLADYVKQNAGGGGTTTVVFG